MEKEKENGEEREKEKVNIYEKEKGKQPHPSSSDVHSELHLANSATSSLINVNVGILGHVDSGKTSLVKALSTHLSTAALDKHPQSRERGITLDLGFSSFILDLLPFTFFSSSALSTTTTTNSSSPFTSLSSSSSSSTSQRQVQITLVDCPGHASLIRTIIGGAQIIDLVILVIDVTRGIQTQTAECIIISEITTGKLIIVLNKIDLIPEEEREERITREEQKIREKLRNSKFYNAPFIRFAAAVGGEKVAAVKPSHNAHPKGGKHQQEPQQQHHQDTSLISNLGIPELYQSLQQAFHVLPERRQQGNFYFAVDHCFGVRGQGTIVTGTVLGGSVKVTDTVELPEFGKERRVKGIQMFKQPVKKITQGDRAAICMTNLDPKDIERTILTSVGAVRSITKCVAVVKRIRLFRNPCLNKAKFHISVGHNTVMARATFFGAAELYEQLEKQRQQQEGEDFNTCEENQHQNDEKREEKSLASSSTMDTSLSSNVSISDTFITSTSKSASISANILVNNRDSNENIVSNQKALLQEYSFDWNADYMYQDCLIAKRNALPHFTFEGESREIYEEEERNNSSAVNNNNNNNNNRQQSLLSKKEEDIIKGQAAFIPQYVLLEFEQPIFAPLGSLLIGSRLDTDIHINTCRIAFYGHILDGLSSRDKPRPLKIYKEKMREGRVLKVGEVMGDKIYDITGGALFKKETDISLFLNLKIETMNGDIGIIESPFGRTGKFRAIFKQGIPADSIHKNQKIFLRFQKYEHDTNHTLIQNDKLFNKNSITLCQMRKTILFMNLRREQYLKEIDTIKASEKKDKGKKQEKLSGVVDSTSSVKNTSKNNNKDIEEDSNNSNNNNKHKKIAKGNSDSHKEPTDRLKKTLSIQDKDKDGNMEMKDTNGDKLPVVSRLRIGKEKDDLERVVDKNSEYTDTDIDTDTKLDRVTNEMEIEIKREGDDVDIDYKISEDVTTLAHDEYELTTTSNTGSGKIVSKTSLSKETSTPISSSSLSSLSSLSAKTKRFGLNASSSPGGRESTARTSKIVLSATSTKNDDNNDNSNDSNDNEGFDSLSKRTGSVDSIKKDDIVIVKGLFSIEEDIKLYIGVKVQCPQSNMEGVVIGPFGKGGKAKIQMNQGTTQMEVGESAKTVLPKLAPSPSSSFSSSTASTSINK